MANGILEILLSHFLFSLQAVFSTIRHSSEAL